jgi:hypothetical protein
MLPTLSILYILVYSLRFYTVQNVHNVESVLRCRRVCSLRVRCSANKSADANTSRALLQACSTYSGCCALQLLHCGTSSVKCLLVRT